MFFGTKILRVECASKLFLLYRGHPLILWFDYIGPWLSGPNSQSCLTDAHWLQDTSTGGFCLTELRAMYSEALGILQTPGSRIQRWAAVTQYGDWENLYPWELSPRRCIQSEPGAFSGKSPGRVHTDIEHKLPKPKEKEHWRLRQKILLSSLNFAIWKRAKYPSGLDHPSSANFWGG